MLVPKKIAWLFLVKITYTNKSERKTMSSTYRVYVYCRLYSLPVDILDYIWSKNHVWAANVIQNRFKSYAQRCILVKVSELRKLVCFAAEESNLGYKMQNYSLFYKDRVYKKRDVFATCRACKCCARHQINKPKNMGTNEPLPFHGTQDTAFDFPFRQLPRFLCN